MSGVCRQTSSVKFCPHAPVNEYHDTPFWQCLGTFAASSLALRILLSAQGLKRERSAAAAETRAVTADALVPDGRTKPRKKSKLAAAVTAAVE